MSQINTNGIDVNYPVPGQNNSSQGFRDNFAQIRTNFNTAGTEITDLQNKVVVKAALDNTTIDNNMANTLISNAAVRGFRSTTYNLGNAISGTLLVDTSLADVQYGAVTGNTTLQFGGWAPTNTESSITLRLTVSNANAVISLPAAAVSSNNNFGVTLLENYTQIGNVATFTAPANTSILEFDITTLDCGVSLTVAPTNRPFQSTQIVTREIPPTGVLGDVNGTVAVGPSVNQLVITGANTNPYLTTSGSTSQLYPDMPIVFTGTSLDANIVVGATYYVRNVVSSNTFTVSSAIGGSNISIGANATGTAMLANPVSYMYVCVDNYNAITSAKETSSTNISGNITLDNVSGLLVNTPIIFTGNVDSSNSTLIANTVYYLKTIDSGNANITVSRSRVNGIAGSTLTLGNSNIVATATFFNGSDIWRQIPLLPDVDTDSNVSAANVVISDNLTVGGNAVINGNLTVNGTYTYENVSTLAVEDPIIGLGRGANNAALSSDDNKDRGVQLWYYSGSEKSAFIGWDDSQQKLIAATDVSIASEVVTVNSYGNFVVGTIESNNAILGNSVTANYFIGSGNNLSNIQSSNITGTVANATHASTANTVTNSTQSNITTVGTLLNLNVSGNITSNNLNVSNVLIASGNITSNANIIGNILANNLDVAGIATIAMVSDLKLGGGLNGYYLVTDGTGNLSWVSGGGTGNGVVGGANTQIQFNDGTGNFAGAPGFTFDNVSNIMSTPGNITSLGNISASYFIGNGLSLSSLAGANVSGAVSYASTANAVAGANVSGEVSFAATANAVAGANVSGAVSYASTANAVAGANVSGEVSFAATANAVAGANVSGEVANANFATTSGSTTNATSATTAGTVTTNAQPNITSVGTLTSLSVSGNTTSNNIASNNYVIVSANSSITASGTVQSDATQLASSINVVTTVPVGSGVKLPVAEAGMRIIVRNSTSTALNVYPNTGAAIEPALANAPYTLNATTSMEFFCSTGGGSGQWFTLF